MLHHAQQVLMLLLHASLQAAGDASMSIPFLEALASCAAVSPANAAAWDKLLRDAIRTFNPTPSSKAGSGGAFSSSRPSSAAIPGSRGVPEPFRDLASLDRPMAVLDTVTRSPVLLKLLALTLVNEVVMLAAQPPQTAGAALCANSVLAPMLGLSPWPNLRVSMMITHFGNDRCTEGCVGAVLDVG